jgi:hypothetical protein
MNISEEKQIDPTKILQKTLRNMTICLSSVFLGYVAIVVMIKADIKNQFFANLGVFLFVVGYFSYIFLSQQLAVAFEKNKGLNFLEVIFFPIGTIANYFSFRKKIKNLIKNNQSK